jgi:hypothetical protein
MKSYQPLAVALLLVMPALTGGAESSGKSAASKPQTHDHRGPKRLMLENGEGARVTLWKPDLTTQPLSIEHGGFSMPKTGMDNYHAVVAERSWGDTKESLIRYEYLFGRPSKHSPSELAGTVKTDLEIVPDPIPREHYRYHSDQTWGFLLRLHGLPAGGIPLTLRTANGTQLEAVSDTSGRVAFHLPDDFPGLVPGARDERSAAFTVSAEMRDADMNYQTTLSADYRVNPAHWQSTRWGWMVAGLGFVAGGLLGRTKNQGGKKP